MEIELNQMWKDDKGNVFVVDGFFDNDKVRCHRSCTTEEVILKKPDFENLEYLRSQNDEQRTEEEKNTERRTFLKAMSKGFITK